MKSERMIAPAACLLILCAAVLASAQAEGNTDTSSTTRTEGGTQATAAAVPPAVTRLEPVFPKDNPDIVYMEGEEAVSTNFDKQAVLNYGCSGSRSLQLNRSTGLQGVSSFYAEYAFQAAVDGTYELWYGGTPPGPRQEDLQSYASPFQAVLDGGKPRAVYREDVAVTETYAPSYYWNRAGELDLKAGRHSLRIEVSEKRRADGHWFFYLDCILLVRKDGGKRLLSDPLPAFYPRNPDNPDAGRPFPTLDDAIIAARDDPSRVQPLIDASLLYTMLSDYLNALKYLNKAIALQPGNAEAAILIAKNRIWKGDAVEGLRKYREFLSRDPSRRDIWLEAGKVAAWSGRYAESIAFLTDGLAAFPKDLGLTVSLGLTRLWAGNSAAAETAFRDAQDIAGRDVAKLQELADAYSLNGYPERAVQTLEQAIRAAPQDLQSYLLLMDTHQRMGNLKEAERMAGLIQSSFIESDRLTVFLTQYRERQGLKEKVIGEYEAKLKENPDNLGLRQVLAQTYFWNGQRRKAIDSYLDILGNHVYRKLKEEETAQADLLFLLDRGYFTVDWFSRLPPLSRKRQADVRAGTEAWRSAARARDESARTVQRAQTDLEAANANREKERAAQAETPVDPGAKDAEQQTKNRDQRMAQRDAEAEKATSALEAAEAKRHEAEAALAAEGGKLMQTVADALALVKQFDGLVALMDGEGERTAVQLEKDKQAEDVFSKQVSPIRWRWDREATVQELERDAKRGSPLALQVLGGIHLSERQARDAETAFRALPLDADPLGEHQAGLAQSLLWQGKTAEAELAIGNLLAASSPSPPYLKDLVSVAASLKDVSGQPETYVEAEAAAKAQEALGELQRIERSGPTERSKVQRTLDELHPVLRRAVVRAFFRYEEATYLLRNDLGDYYLAEEDLEPAILQFRKVLAIDPNDLSALFRLGKVYQWNRNWSAAMDSFRTVYNADPEYENVTSLYNKAAREHTDTLTTTSYVLADPNKFTWHGGTSYRKLLNSFLGLVAGYQTENVQGDTVVTSSTAATMERSYQVHDISAGILLDLYFLRMTLTPAAGLYLWSDPEKYTAALDLSSVSLMDTLLSYDMDPYVKVDATLGLGDYVYLNGTFRWGRQTETLDPARADVTDTSGEANLSASLAFLDVPVLHDTSMRTYGKVESLSDGNRIWTAVEEMTVYLYKGGNPWTTLALTGNATWQDSQDTKTNYYTPQGVLLAGGSLTGATWIGLMEGTVLGLSLRGYAGGYWEKLLDPALTTCVLKLEGQVDATLTQGNLTFTLSALANATLDTATSLWKYWSMYLNLNCAVKLPNLIAP